MVKLNLNLLKDDIIRFNKSWKKLKKLHKKLMHNIEVSDGLLFHQIIDQKIRQYEYELNINNSEDKKVLINKIDIVLEYLDKGQLNIVLTAVHSTAYNNVRGRQN